jgi:hypothetical protein
MVQRSCPFFAGGAQDRQLLVLRQPVDLQLLELRQPVDLQLLELMQPVDLQLLELMQLVDPSAAGTDAAGPAGDNAENDENLKRERVPNKTDQQLQRAGGQLPRQVSFRRH